MPVVCRFRVIEKAEVEHWKLNPSTKNYEPAYAHRIKMTGVKSGVFGDATPSADLNMLIVPDDAAAEFKTGKVYLVTFELDPNQES